MSLSFQKKQNTFPLPDKRFLRQLKKIIGFTPKHRQIYQLALLHKSASRFVTNDLNTNNERLEYLGDAIFDAVIAEFLYEQFPEENEGFLTQMRAKIVNRETLKNIAIKLGIGDILKCKLSNENHKAIYGDALEALIGAIYIDKGYKNSKKVITKKILNNFINLEKLVNTEIDFKSRIIEWSQKKKVKINFSCREKMLDTSGSPVFIAQVFISDELTGIGIGNTKKEAEQKAAKQALKYLE